MVGAIRANDGEIVWVVGSDEARVASYAEQHTIPKSGTNLESMLSDWGVDAVYISSTNEKHLPQAISVIASGIHVLCEKPLAMNSGDAGKMVRAAQDREILFGTNHHLRNAGSHKAIRI